MGVIFFIKCRWSEGSRSKVESAHGCQVSVYELKIVRIATEESETTKMETRRLETAGERDGGWYGRWPRWRLHQSLSEKWKEERFSTIDRVSSSSSSSTTRYIRYIHVYTHTYSASCSCDLEPEPTNSHRSVSLFFDLSIRAEKSSAMKIDATFVICGTERLFVFSKKENYRFYIYFIERNFYKAWIFFERV